MAAAQLEQSRFGWIGRDFAKTRRRQLASLPPSTRMEMPHIGTLSHRSTDSAATLNL